MFLKNCGWASLWPSHKDIYVVGNMWEKPKLLSARLFHSPSHKSICHFWHPGGKKHGPICDESRRGSTYCIADHCGFLWVLSNLCLCSSTMNQARCHTKKSSVSAVISWQIQSLPFCSRQTQLFDCGTWLHDILKTTTSCLGVWLPNLSRPLPLNHAQQLPSMRYELCERYFGFSQAHRSIIKQKQTTACFLSTSPSPS